MAKFLSIYELALEGFLQGQLDCFGASKYVIHFSVELLFKNTEVLEIDSIY